MSDTAPLIDEIPADPEREAATKAAVLNAAERLFALNGFQSVSELNRERARMLHAAADRHGGKPPVREILAALLEPPLRWSRPDHERRISVQFIIRARSEGTEAMRDVLRTDVSHLRRFADALIGALPHLPAEDVYWRLHFTLGMTHNNRFAEFDRLHALSDGLTRESDVDALLQRMLDFAEAGFLA